MNRLSTVSSINSPVSHRRLVLSSLSIHQRLFLLGFLCVFAFGQMSASFAQEKQREPMEMSVVVVNPSKTDIKKIPIKMYLPKEVTPAAIIDSNGLDVEFDTDSSIYYLYKDEVILQPNETRTYNVVIKNIWVFDEARITALKNQTTTVLNQLVNHEGYEEAKKLGDAIFKALDTVLRTQNDDTISRRRQIGVYRDNLQIIEQVKDDLAMLEKKLKAPQALPVPDVMEKAEIKADAPTKTTTWMIIFIIMLFMGMLAGVFFFTWQTQAHFTKNLIANAKNLVFPKRGSSEEEKAEKEQPKS